MFESIKIYKGGALDYKSLASQLVEYGYERREMISETGDFSMRGGIIDIFPPTFEGPVRIELSGNIVESIRSYSMLSSETLEEHAMTIILPKLGIYPKRKKVVDLGEKIPLVSFVDIQVNDYVVHVDHGIGIFRGFKKIKFGEEEKENIIIDYADNDRLYVPIEEMHLIQKYVAFERRPPKLYKLGSKMWKAVKERVKKGIHSMAFELLEINAMRSKLDGFRFSKDTEWQAQFENNFSFKETSDQLRSTAEVKKDMESTRPMDRLLCGDVGYGKTEVALRAAFKAIMDNKQVAMLVPTTILAEQHFITFKNRMKDFPIMVEMVSRFRTQSETGRILKEAENGAIDILIGTHAILRKDIRFKDLGLVIIDEEQRFGVKDKEKLKKVRLTVDVLTLTATPIPRTLYMSLMGVKDMSIIETPPKDRLPVEVIVAEYDDNLIKKAILFEKKRNGQVFFVHNRIEGIEKIADRIRGLVPGVKVALAHGRMHSKELESIMRDFMKGDIDVLISTVIIESGIDIPNANTLIVNRSDMFGLADLYQLKGRVGRFKNKAHAYFLVPRGHILSRESERRLDALERYKDLGSGFKIAMEDLEIRGAGNLLGKEQHGYISAIGFDLYCRILKEIASSLRSSQ
ncbi:MAG: transcription-repair coupling factor [Candidatus Omnitrophica bacterium CG1_02_40_15]|nr:MAG: transcription-repair coupling factor [Candidatus Omnitrophica bacterium CG1_02_40_15]